MERNGIVAVFFLLLIVADVSNASLLSKLRKLIVVVDPENNSDPIQASPSPSPVPVEVDTKSSEDRRIRDKSKVDSKGSNGIGTIGPRNQNQRDGDGDIEKNKKRHNDETELSIEQSCTGVARRCTDQNSLVACILNFGSESKKLVILVQNEGESLLKVNLTAPNPVDNALLEIQKHQTKKMSLSLGNSAEVILMAGNGKCVLHIDRPVSHENPSYDNLITPINGAYFLILTVIIFGGTWVCCMSRRRRQQGGIPYQELEMGLPEPSMANNVVTTEAWGQGWDDDWDGENAGKSPAAHPAGSISANGLTSRSSNRDWDD